MAGETSDLLEALSVATRLDEALWTGVMLDRGLQGLRLDDPSSLGHIQCIVSVHGSSHRPNPVFHSLLRRTAALLRQTTLRPPQGRGGGATLVTESRRGPLNALHLCAVCTHFAAQRLEPTDAARALGRPAADAPDAPPPGGVRLAPLEELVDAALDLVAAPDVTPGNYEVVLEGVNLLVAVLATQLYSSSFDSSTEEDAQRRRVLEQQQTAYDATTLAQNKNAKQASLRPKSPPPPPPPMAANGTTPLSPPPPARQQQQQRRRRGWMGWVLGGEEGDEEGSDAIADGEQAAAAAASSSSTAVPTRRLGGGACAQIMGSACAVPDAGDVEEAEAAERDEADEGVGGSSSSSSSFSSSSSSSSLAVGDSKTPIKTAPSSTNQPPLPPLPRLPPLEHYGLQVVMAADGGVFASEVNEGAAHHQMVMLRRQHRAEQATRVVEAVLGWFVERPAMPQGGLGLAASGASFCEATTAAVATQRALLAMRQRARAAAADYDYYEPAASSSSMGMPPSPSPSPSTAVMVRRRGGGGAGRLFFGGKRASQRRRGRNFHDAGLLAPAGVLNVSPVGLVATAASFLHRRVLSAVGAVLYLPFAPVVKAYNFFAGTGGSSLALSSSASASSSSSKASESSKSSKSAGSTGAASPELLSPLCERGALLLLLLVHNDRAGTRRNPFRAALAALRDPRFDGLFAAFPLSPLGGAAAGAAEAGADDPELGMQAPVSAAAAAAAAAGAGSSSSLVPMASFEGLLQSFGRLLSDDAVGEPATLLLYTLLHSSASPSGSGDGGGFQNSAFLDSLLARSDLDTLLLPLLQRLYGAPDIQQPTPGGAAHAVASSSASSAAAAAAADDDEGGFLLNSVDARPTLASLYVSIIVLLTFTQDEGFDSTAFQHLFLPGVDWYEERFMKNVSLGSLTVLCVLRTLVYTLSRANDLYLLENCLAILGNLAPHAEGLHPYAAQRVVAVAIMVLKRHAHYAHKLAAARAGGAAAAAAAGGGQQQLDEQELEPMVHVYARCVGALLNLLNACLRPRQVAKNASLVYAVMHRQREFDAAFGQLASLGGAGDDEYGLSAAVGALPALVVHMNAELAAARNALALGYASVDAMPPYLDAYSVDGDVRGEGGGGAGATTNLTVEKTMAALERGAAAYAKRHLPPPGALFHPAEEPSVKITYREQAEPESFFVPYTWEVVKSHTALDQCWR